jgi:hypothetical protein
MVTYVHALSVNICVCHDHLLDRFVLTTESLRTPFNIFRFLVMFYVIVNYSFRDTFILL